MAQEKTTIARPYAEAVFARARETENEDLWSEMLGLLAAVVRTPEIAGLIANPKLSRARLEELMLDIGGGRLNDEGQNLLRLLVRNDRLAVIPEIAELYETRKRENQGKLQVKVRSAYALDKAHEKALAEALSAKLGREIEISAEKDTSLIGGVEIRAGDLVIDGSVRGQLRKLANELNI
jgi:F-type H+-transporting ATPase subunit delta